MARIGAPRSTRPARSVWNGPLGAFETPPFDHGTTAVAKKAAALTRAGRLRSVAGGGDTVAALAAAGLIDELSYVSTAGGAFLEWLEGRELPGVAALVAAAAAIDADGHRRSHSPETGRPAMNASDVMTRNVVTCGRHSIREAIRLMLDNNVSGLPVVDAAGRVEGILTEGDLLRRAEIATERSTGRGSTFLLGPGRWQATMSRPTAASATS